MKIIKAGFHVLSQVNGTEILKSIEEAGRVCYKSEDKITDGSAEKFVANIIKRGHEAVLEHEKITVKFIVDRGVSHEIVRHRIAAYCQEMYLQLIHAGAKPQEARSVLPNSLKTEVVMTANLREWRHFFKLRTSPAAHPQMREVAIPLLKEFQMLIPVVFDDIEVSV